MRTIRLILVAVGTAACCVGDARAEVTTESIEYDHDGVALAGYLAYDDALSGKRPGVLVVHEWYGLHDYARTRARQLAGLGYVAFALDMYGKDKVTDDPEQARHWSGQFHGTDLMRRRARAALDVLAGHERVDPNRIAAIGYCFGGTTVLELAYSGADLVGVVSFHGSLPAPKPEDDANIKAKILVCHGADDPFVPADMVAAFKRAMRRAGADWQLIAYPGARHSFTNPAADRDDIDGTAYDERADKQSWQKMQQLFEEVFATAEQTGDD